MLAHRFVAASEGTKTDGGTMMLRPESNSIQATFADPPELQTLRPL
jgi:hypothetical protein